MVFKVVAATEYGIIVEGFQMVNVSNENINNIEKVVYLEKIVKLMRHGLDLSEFSSLCMKFDESKESYEETYLYPKE